MVLLVLFGVCIYLRTLNDHAKAPRMDEVGVGSAIQGPTVIVPLDNYLEEHVGTIDGEHILDDRAQLVFDMVAGKDGLMSKEELVEVPSNEFRTA